MCSAWRVEPGEAAADLSTYGSRDKEKTGMGVTEMTNIPLRPEEMITG